MPMLTRDDLSGSTPMVEVAHPLSFVSLMLFALYFGFQIHFKFFLKKWRFPSEIIFSAKIFGNLGLI